MSHRRPSTPLRPLGDVLGGADFVWEAKARAEAARALAAKTEAAPAPKQPPARSEEAERMVLALLERFGGAPEAPPGRQPAVASVPVRQVLASRARAPEPKPTPAPAPVRVATAATGFARPDDGTLADPMWLQFELGQVPTLQKGDFRASRERHPRGVWRRALAATIQRPPGQLGSPGGALIAQLRRVVAQGHDPREGDTYCAAPGWGPHAYRFAGVEGLIHQDYECRCRD